jgi:hypothetical protein
MNPPDYRRTGISTIAAGIAAVLAMLVVLTGLGSGNWLLGSLGDLMDVVNSALIMPLFILLGGMAMAESPLLGRVIQVLGVIGALTRLVGAFLILSGLMVIDEALLFVNAGLGFLGVALLLSLPASRRELGLGTGASLFTLVVGVGMAVTLVGAFFNDAYLPLLQGEIGLAEMPPILAALLIFAPVQLLGYPIWLLWIGRRLLQIPESQAAHLP